MLTDEDNQDSLTKLEMENSVFSDLRAIRLLEKMQKDIDKLQKSQARLKFFLSITSFLVVFTIIALAGMFLINQAQLKQLPSLQQQELSPSK